MKLYGKQIDGQTHEFTIEKKYRNLKRKKVKEREREGEEKGKERIFLLVDRRHFFVLLLLINFIRMFLAEVIISAVAVLREKF